MLKRLPDLSAELRKAPVELKRQIFDAFQLRIVYDKVGRRIEISATVSEAVAKAFDKTKGLPEEVQRVAQRDIAGARYNARGDAARIRSLVRDPARCKSAMRA